MASQSQKYFNLLKKAYPSINQEEMMLPVRETSIDSIDLVLVRVTLEKFIGKEIPNSVWNNFVAIQDAINFCIKNENSNSTIRNTKNISVKRKIQINMPQMANSVLSENWLFKELGDIHWDLLGKGLNTNSSCITDELGNRLYATFTRIRFSNLFLYDFNENESISFYGEIKCFGLSTYISEIVFKSKRCNSKATLMTSFTTRDSIDNSKLFKSQPSNVENIIPELESTPEILNDYRLLRKGLLETFKMAKEEFFLSSSPVYETKYTINPFYEINGVGLLYFAAYPIISDSCESKYFNRTKIQERWESKYFTRERDIFYFSNCNIDDLILYRLNSFEFLENGNVKLFSSLYRAKDMNLMAHIFTIKQTRIK